MPDEIKDLSPRNLPPRNLPPEARRALTEAAERKRKEAGTTLPNELGGRNGPEPVRFGDWERNGIAVDF